MNIINHQAFTPRLSGVDVSEKRQELKDYFNQTWATYESLFSLINSDEAYFERPERLRHPLIFYFGHTATFYINKLILGKFIDHRLNTRIEAVCAVGVDEMSWDDLDATHYEWPNVEEVREYRNQVSALINHMIDTMDIVLPIKEDSLAWVILMGCEHERIHLETSSVIMRMLPLKHLTATKDWATCEIDNTIDDNILLPLSAQEIILGKKANDDTYGWDNEYGVQNHSLNAFKASKYIVSNQEFMAFIKADGYINKQYWNDEGQKWLNFSQASMPRFWQVKNGEYYQRNLLNEMPLPLSWPAEVNYLEAKAFCNWKSEITGKNIHLPSEAQWQVLRGEEENLFNESANINLAKYASSCPVNMFSQGDFFDVSGNVWQWSESIIDGFDGFAIHPLYDDFSTPTFDGKHNLILGGSWISTGNEILKSSRYAFRRHFFQHAGFRYVENETTTPPIQALNAYENDPKVTKHLNSHYDTGTSAFGIAPYYEALSELIKQSVHDLEINPNRLLDLGCKVGRVSFELSKSFNHIDAVDFSAAPIKHAVQLQQGQEVRYTVKAEGEILNFKKAGPLPKALLLNENLIFSQGDASNLKTKYTGYDVVLAQNVLEENYNPRLFLKDVSHRLNANGLLILVTDYLFDDESISNSSRIGGKKINGENVTGFEALSELLTPLYHFMSETDLSQVLQVDTRHFKVNQYHVTLWKKR